MANLKSIKTKIISYKKTGTVTHAMEAVSAVKMRKTQERALSGRSYAAAALTVLERLSGTADISRHLLMQERSGRTALILITSDKGLAGALNSGVMRTVEQELRARGLQKNNMMIYALGKRGGEYFKSRGYEVVMRTNISDSISENEVLEITGEILKDSGLTSVLVAYQNFISSFEQEPVVRQIVPIKPEAMRALVAGIRPAKGKYAPESVEARPRRIPTYTVEPEPQEVLGVLLPRLLNIAVFHAMLEAKASEHSARMVAMKNATDKAKEKAQDLTRTFNKVRQAAITREVSEITSGMEAMR